MNKIFGNIEFPFKTPPEEGAAIEVATGILWIRLPLPMALDHVNVYALDDGDGWVIVDTGYHSKRGVKLWEKLLKGPLGGKPVKKILMTHHHPDHIGNVGWFQKHHNVELISTRTAWLYSRMMVLDEQTQWPPELAAFYKSTGMDADIYEERLKNKPFNYADIVHPMPLGFTRICQDDVLSIGGRTWTVHIGNGHAPAHATLWCNEEPLVIAGDQILPGISSNVGVYATEPDADPLTEWLESCERLAQYANEDHLVFPGHKLPFTGLPARLNQLIENHHNALARLEDFLDTPRTAVECFPLLFKRKIEGGNYGLAMVEALAHLNNLLFAGKVTKIANSDGIWLWKNKRG
jgi:glyoxylase-like metal-dependent hydrolase (beta-lactamase superfamily II)